MRKRLLAMAMAVLMLVGLFPVSALAAEETSYDCYYYTLVPGTTLDAVTGAAGEADRVWNGMGVGRISGVNDPSTYSTGTLITGETHTEPSSYPDITVTTDEGIATYQYAAPDSGNETKKGYYTVEWIRTVVSGGANAGANNYNPTVNWNTRTFHRDGQIFINAEDLFNVTFYIQEPGEEEFTIQENYSKLVKSGTAESALTKPSTSDKTVDGVVYTFDGWYKDEDCTEEAEFDGTITARTDYYGKYVPKYYTVIYDNGGHGTLAGENSDGQVVHKNVAFKTATPEDPAVTPGDGYCFTGWEPERAATVTGNAEYVAQYAHLTATGYSGKYDGKSHDGVTGADVEGGASNTDWTYTYSTDGETYAGDVPQFTDAGTYTVYVKAASSEYGEMEVPVEVTIEKRDVTLTSETASKEYDGTALTRPDVAVTGDGFVSGEVSKVEATGSVTYAGESETNTIVITPGDGYKESNYNIMKKEGTLSITNRAAKYEITVEANSATGKYDGTEKSVSGLKQTAFTVNGQTFTVSGLSASASGTDAGTYPANVTGTAVVTDAKGNDVTAQFIVNKVSGELKINPRAVTLTSATDSKEYDGTALTRPDVTVAGDGFVAGEVSDIKATGSVTYAGETVENTITYTKKAAFKQSNYVITENVGQLSITNRDAKYEVEVVANSDEFLYDGTEKTVTGFQTLEVEAANGLTYTVSGLTASGSGTDAGSYTVGVTGTAVVTDEDGVDVTAQFDVTATPGTLIINKRQVTLTSASDSKEYDGTPLTNHTVTVGGDKFADGEGASYTVTGTRTLEGTSKNAFTYTLNEGTKAGNYNITTTEGQLTILNRTAKYQITVEANSATGKYDGTEQSVSGFQTLEFTVNGVTFTVEGLTASAKGTNAGEYTASVEGTPVVRDAEGNDVTKQFAVSTRAGKLTINKRVVTLTSGDATKEFDGTPLTNHEVTVGGDGWADGEGATYTVTGSQKRPGSSSNAFTYALNAGTSADNYEITKSEGTLTVTNRTVKYEITVEANSATGKYDGTEKSVSGFKTLEFELGDVTFTVEGLTVSAKGTDAGEYTASVEGTPVVSDADGFDVTDQFIVNTVDGTLTIEKRNVTLTSATDTKKYDGTPLTNNEVTVSGDGFAEGEGATYTVTGSQLITGNSANTFTYTLNSNTKAENYNITKNEGTLTVIDRDAKYEITVEANSAAGKYDGTEKSVSGFKTLEFTVNGQKYTVSGLSAGASGTDAGEYPANVTGTAVVTDAEGNDVTNQFAVKTSNGTLTIEKRQVTLTSASDSKEYDGLPLTNDTVTVGGDKFADGEGATYTVTGTRTLEGSSPNYFSYTLDEGTNAKNYNITKNEGTLTVTNRDAKYEITVVANSGEFLYDGTEKSVSGFQTLEFTVNGQKYTVEGLTAERKATDAGTYTVNVTGTPVVKDAGGNDVSNQFAVSTQEGTLIINKRSVTLTSESASKQYDKTPLERPDVTVTGDGFVEGEVTEIKATGSVTNVGSATNTIVYTTGENFKADNYTITKNEGKLTVTKADGLTLLVDGYEGKYDAQEHSVTVTDVVGDEDNTVWTYTYSTDGETYSDEMPQFTDAGEYTVYVKASNPNYEDLTASATVTITPRSVTLTSASDSKVLDGTALTNATVTVSGDGFVEGEGAAYDVTGSQTEVGSSENKFTYTLNDNTKADNYVIETVFGTLTVYAKGLKVEKTVDKTQAKVGDTLVYTITVTNTGDVELTNITVTDPMLNVEKNIGALAPGEVWSESFTYEVQSADAGKTIVNTAVAQAEDGTKGEGSSGGTEIEKPSSGGGTEIEKPSSGGGGGSTVLNTKDHYSYIIGYQDGTVRPYGTITRGEVATIFFRLLTDEARDKYWSQDSGYSDCGPDLWCNNAISTLSNMGIISGYSDGTFRPYAKITRAQFAKIAVGFFETTTQEYAGYYSDVPEDAWYTDYVEAASRVGLIQGFQDGTFRPNENITRAQACVIVNRALNRTPDKDRLLPVAEMITWPDCTPDDWFYADIQEATNSHDYTMITVKGEKVEKWSEKLPQRDWAAFEHAWSTAHSAPGGEVVK